MNWADVLTKIGAALGPALGILNVWQNWRQRKVYVAVIPTRATLRFQVGTDPEGQVCSGTFITPAIDVVNHSNFPITITEVGYEVDRSETYRLSRIDAPVRWQGHMPVSEKLPQRMESRTSLRLAWSDQDKTNLKGKQIRRAYAKTACGTTAHGHNSELRRLVECLKRGKVVIERIRE